MTRIAGLVAAWPKSRLQTGLGALIGHFGALGSEARTQVGERSAMASTRDACGGQSIATSGNICAVVDGAVFNSGEFGSTGKGVAPLFIEQYEQHGFVEALQRINGDFAVALFDADKGRLWLARDRVGVRPLYYASAGDAFGFASLPGALLRLPAMCPEVNAAFVARFAGSHYRTFDNSPEESPFRDVHQLPAAHALEVDGNGRTRLVRYWTMQDHPDLNEPEADLAERYRDLLLDAVNSRLSVAKTPGFLLSGGMDSSSVLASAVRATGARQHAFSSVYSDETYDESADIQTMLDDNVEQWHAINVEPSDLFGTIRDMVRVHDEPVATATWLSHYQLAREVAGKGFDALFGGLGGDELNAGEYEHFFYHFADLQRDGKHDALEREIGFWVKYHDHPIFKKNAAVAHEGLARLVDLEIPGRCLPDSARLGRYAATVRRDYHDVAGFVPVMDHPFRSYLKNRTYQDIFRETAPCCLRAEDRQASVFGVQSFVPFLDYRLLEFMFRVPGHLKIRDGVTKVLLRKATNGLLPDDTRMRIKKTGWNAPAHLWFTGDNLEHVRDMVASRSFRERGIHDVEEVTRVIDEHEAIVLEGANRDNHMMFLWQLVNLETWLTMVDEQAGTSAVQ